MTSKHIISHRETDKPMLSSFHGFTNQHYNLFEDTTLQSVELSVSTSPLVCNESNMLMFLFSAVVAPYRKYEAAVSPSTQAHLVGDCIHFLIRQDELNINALAHIPESELRQGLATDPEGSTVWKASVDVRVRDGGSVHTGDGVWTVRGAFYIRVAPEVYERVVTLLEIQTLSLAVQQSRTQADNEALAAHAGTASGLLHAIKVKADRLGSAGSAGS